MKFIRNIVHYIYDEELLPLSRENTANYITLLGAWLSRFGLVCFIGYLMLFFLEQQVSSTAIVLRYSGIVLFTLAAISDGVDGYVARKMYIVSRFGELYDPHLDKVQYVTKVNGLLIDAVVAMLCGASWQFLLQVFLIGWMTQERDLTCMFHRLWAVREDPLVQIGAGSSGKWRTRICFPCMLVFFLVINPLQSIVVGWILTCLIILTTAYSTYDYVHRYRIAIKTARNKIVIS